MTLRGREDGALRGRLLGSLDLGDEDEIERRDREVEEDSAHGSRDTEDFIQNREDDGDDRGQERPEKGLQVAAMRRTRLLETELVERDEVGKRESRVGEENHEGVGEFDDVEIPDFVVREVRQQVGGDLVAISEVAEGSHDEVDSSTAQEGNGVHAGHLADLVGELAG